MTNADAGIAMTLQNTFMKKLGVDPGDKDAMYYLREAYRKAFPKVGYPAYWGSWPMPKNRVDTI